MHTLWSGKPNEITIWQSLSPGDMCPLLVGVQNLKRHRPDLKINLIGPAPDLLRHHPDLTPVRGRLIVPAYDGKTACNKGQSFVQAYHESLEKTFGKFPMVETSPRLYLSPEEDSPPPYLPKDYCLIVSGSKRDLTVKRWGWWNFQKVVDATPDLNWVQIGHDDGGKWHDHPRLKGTMDMVGRTSLRELMRVIKYARVLVCGVTLMMWIASAFKTRSVIITGGREPSFFLNLPNQIYHDTTRELSCGRDGRGCWNSRTQLLHDGFFLDKPWTVCTNQYNFPDGLDVKTPKCMQLISPDEVVDSVRRQLSRKAPLTLV